MPATDATTTIQQLKDEIVHFRGERNWGRHHQPKNVAMSICIEAAELLEHFQWDASAAADKQGIADELSDVISYCLSFADIMGIDIATAFRAKMAKNAQKYPLDEFATKSAAEDMQAYQQIKQRLRADKDQAKAQKGTPTS